VVAILEQEGQRFGYPKRRLESGSHHDGVLAGAILDGVEGSMDVRENPEAYIAGLGVGQETKPRACLDRVCGGRSLIVIRESQREGGHDLQGDLFPFALEIPLLRERKADLLGASISIMTAGVDSMEIADRGKIEVVERIDAGVVLVFRRRTKACRSDCDHGAGDEDGFHEVHGYPVPRVWEPVDRRLRQPRFR